MSVELQVWEISRLYIVLALIAMITVWWASKIKWDEEELCYSLWLCFTSYLLVWKLLTIAVLK